MEYRQLGNSGVRVSAIGLGTNQFGGKVDQAGVNNIIDAAIDVGINFFDTADMYQKGRSETSLGVAFKGKRDDLLIATKAAMATGDGTNDIGASRYHVMNNVELSLKRLQTDRIDLYQMHRWDDRTPIEETLRTLDDLVRSGKVRYVGASNYFAWQLARANMIAEFRGLSPFITIQNHYHMFERGQELEMLPYCDAHHVGMLPFFPLAGGFLTGKYKRGEPAPTGSRGEQSAYIHQYMNDKNYTKIEQLTAWAEEREHTMGELAHAWLLAQPQVSSVISGATKVEHILSNTKGADWSLDEEELVAVNGILED